MAVDADVVEAEAISALWEVRSGRKGSQIRLC